MFNSLKSSEIKDKAGRLADSTKDAVIDAASDAKDTAREFTKRVGARTQDTKADAEALIDSLRELLSDKPITQKSDELKERITDQYYQWKNTLQDEISNAVSEGQARSRKVLNEQPLLTLAVAVGTGAFIGYLLGSYKSDNS